MAGRLEGIIGKYIGRGSLTNTGRYVEVRSVGLLSCSVSMGVLTHWSYDCQTPWNRVVLKKLIMAEGVKKLLYFLENEDSLRCSEMHTTSPYSEPN
jgi:hypothetical protein